MSFQQGRELIARATRHLEALRRGLEIFGEGQRSAYMQVSLAQSIEDEGIRMWAVTRAVEELLMPALATATGTCIEHSDAFFDDAHEGYRLCAEAVESASVVDDAESRQFLSALFRLRAELDYAAAGASLLASNYRNELPHAVTSSDDRSVVASFVRELERVNAQFEIIGEEVERLRTLLSEKLDGGDDGNHE